MYRHRHVVPVLALALAGCATTQAPRELVDARAAYTRASDGPARELVPAQLLSAQQALARAERSFVDAPDAPSTRDLAYIAERKAEDADAQARTASDLRDKESAQRELGEIQASRQAHMQNALSETRAELASERNVLAVKQQELTAAQRARKEAERSARDAVESLEKVAAVKEEARGLVITLSGAVLFATGQSTLLPIARDRLSQVAHALKDNPRGAILVEGHTDSIGSASSNEELSRQRAEAVRAYLVEQGVAADRVRAVGLGSSRPIADNNTPEGRANNRRVEIVVQPAGATPQ